MRSIDEDEVFLEHHYKYYNNLRIFIMAAIQAAKDLGFQEQDSKNRIIVAERKEKTYIAKEQKFTELSATADITEKEIDNNSKDTVIVSLQEEATQAIIMLVQARQDQWHILIQDILDGKTTNTQISSNEAALLAHEFGDKKNITVPGLIAVIKSNMIGMMQRANQGVICRNDDAQEMERARPYRRWLRKSKDKIQQEVDFLCYLDSHFIEPSEIKDEFATFVKSLIDDISRNITVPTNPPKYNQLKPNIHQLTSRGVFKTSPVSYSVRNKNKMILESAIASLSILIDNIVKEEDFAWYASVQIELTKWKTELTNQSSIIENTYGLKNTLDSLEKSFAELDSALLNDEKIYQELNEHLDTENARRLSEEAMTQFRALKKHLRAAREELDEYAIVRFFKNIFSALGNPRKTLRLVWKWMRANPLTTVGISIVVLGIIGLTAFAPYATLPLVALGASLAAADAIATTALVVGAVALTTVVVSSTASAGSLVKIEQRNKMSKLEQDVDDAEERANEAERRASAAEAAYRRKKLEGYASEKEAIDEEEKVLQAQMEALRAKRQAITANANLDRTKAQEMERAALPQHPTNQEVAKINLQLEEDNLDGIIEALEESGTQIASKQIELTTKRNQTISNINKQRDEAEQRILRASATLDRNDSVTSTNTANIPDILVSRLNLRHQSMFEEREETGQDGDTVFNQILVSVNNNNVSESTIFNKK